MYKAFLKELGFDSSGDLLATVLGFSTKPLMILQIVGATFFVGTEFISLYVYQPPAAIYIVAILILSDTSLEIGYAWSCGKVLNLRKLTRVVPALLAHLGIMSMAYHMSLAEPIMFAWLPSAVFGFFSLRNFLSVIQNMIRFGWLRGEFLEYLNKRIAAASEPPVLSQDAPDAQH